jgi:hypothetical protein
VIVLALICGGLVLLTGGFVLGALLGAHRRGED